MNISAGAREKLENFPSKNSPATSHRRHYHAQVDGTDYKTHIYTFTTSVWIPNASGTHIWSKFSSDFQFFIAGKPVKNGLSDQFTFLAIFLDLFQFFVVFFPKISSCSTVNPRHCPLPTLLQLHFTEKIHFFHSQTRSEPFAAHRKKILFPNRLGASTVI